MEKINFGVGFCPGLSILKSISSLCSAFKRLMLVFLGQTGLSVRSNACYQQWANKDKVEIGGSMTDLMILSSLVYAMHLRLGVG